MEMEECSGPARECRLASLPLPSSWRWCRHELISTNQLSAPAAQCWFGYAAVGIPSAVTRSPSRVARPSGALLARGTPKAVRTDSVVPTRRCCGYLATRLFSLKGATGRDSSERNHAAMDLSACEGGKGRLAENVGGTGPFRRSGQLVRCTPRQRKWRAPRAGIREQPALRRMGEL